jgi:lysine-N-methylase
MPLPVRSLPVVQNWDCQSCSACCRSYHVPVSAEERRTIESQGWDQDSELKNVPFFVREGSWLSGREWRLNHKADGSCVFLGADNRCRIHAKFGSAGKPLACRVYPFMLVPVGDHWRLGLRFACPSAAASVGRPLAEHVAEAQQYATLLEENSPSAKNVPPPPLRKGQVVKWDDVFRIVTAISKTLGNEADPLERRWRKVLGLVQMLRAAEFDGGEDPKKAVTGGRLSEMLHVLGMAMEDDAPKTAAEVPPPGWVGRMMFRSVLAVYARKDHGTEKGTAQRTALGRIGSAIAFARGKGRIPKLHAWIPDATFDMGEFPSGPLSDNAMSLLTRYYRLKVESLQFCGPTNFDMPVWDGLESLALTFPAIMWLSRVFAAGGKPRDEAVELALRAVDDNFGFNKLLGLGRQKYALKLLSGRGELPRLVAWYSR